MSGCAAQPTISDHTTMILADSGPISGEKGGLWVRWQVVPERVAAIGDALAPTQEIGT